MKPNKTKAKKKCKKQKKEKEKPVVYNNVTLAWLLVSTAASLPPVAVSWTGEGMVSTGTAAGAGAGAIKGAGCEGIVLGTLPTGVVEAEAGAKEV